jgi:FkbM family methyltransferase
LQRWIAEFFDAARSASRVAAGPRSFFELLYVFALSYVDRRKTPFRRFVLCVVPGAFLASARESQVAVSLRCNGRVFQVIFPTRGDTEFWSIRSTITEVLLKQVYRPSNCGEVSTVVDAGANHGLASLYLSTFFPDAEFVCFEPSLETFQVLQQNLNANRLRHRAVRKALTDHDGVARFDLGKSSMERSMAAEGTNATEEVPCAALKDELDRLDIAQIDFLKIDVEGEEVRLLDGLGDAIGDVREIVGEVHSAQLAEGVRARLTGAGFSVSEMDGHLRGVRAPVE